MTEHDDGGRTVAEGLARKLQSMLDSLSDDERRLFESVLAQAAAHPDALLVAADSSEADVRGYSATYLGGIGPPPPPGPGPIGGGGQLYFYSYQNWYYFR